MALETKQLERVFRYNSIELPDPGPQYGAEAVRDLYANTYPEITTAAIEGPEQKDDRLVYTFRRAVGTKGCGPWIPVAVSLPEHAKSVLINVTEDHLDLGELPYVEIGMYNERQKRWQRNWGDDDIVVEVSHWIPLPEAVLP